MEKDPNRIVLHAPTPGALKRARGNAANLTAAGATVRIVVNAEAVAAALDDSDTAADPITMVCPNTLKKLGRENRAPLVVLETGAVAALARLQADGWCYIRA